MLGLYATSFVVAGHLAGGMRYVSTNVMKRAGALGSIALILVLLSGMSAAGAAVANPAVTTGTLTIKTEVHNAGHGGATPDSFTYHVIRASDSADVADGIFNHSGTTKIKLAPGTYAVTEDPIEPYTENVGGCAHVAITAAAPKTCTISNVWTFAKIEVSTSITNAGGGKNTPSDFHYHVVDANTNATVASGAFSNSGTTTIGVPDGTYSVTENVAYGYDEDYSSCSGLTVDLADPATCIVANTFDPHTTTTISNTTTSRPGSKQETVHGSAVTEASCLMTLQPALQAPSTNVDAITMSADAFPDPHKGDPITLSNSKISVTTPASLLQTGVDLGIINAGQVLPEKGTVVIGGDGTVQGTKTFQFSTTETVVVVGGKAQPLVATATLSNSTWNPSNATDPVFLSVKSLKIVETISSAQLGGAVTSTSTCSTPNGPSFLALSAQGGAIPTTTAGSGGGTGGTGGSGTGGSGGAGGSGTGATGSDILPVTGASVWLWLAPGVLCIYIGLLAIGATARKRRRVLN